jgi:hypothetical protein
MMTLTQAERLVRKIAEVAAEPGSDTQTAKLAHDYAEVCRAANRRLEQCALMIEAGQFLQALQLAETSPPLLDLITLLGFRQAAEWRSYCQAHQLPWPEPFYEKHVRQLNNAYAKGVSGDHPFYGDYRRAVMEKDDTRAQSILRVISRMNPADANTKEELKRLEEKLLRVKLENLRQVVAAGDLVNIQACLEQLEASGLPVPASHPVWQQAQVARCQQMLRRAEQLRQEENWRDVEAVVEEIHAFATRYNVRLPDADADAWTALDEWTTSQRAAHAAEQDFHRAVSALEYEVKTVESQRAAGARLGQAGAKAALDSLAGKWRETERFGSPLDPELAGQCQESADWLGRQIRSADRKKRLVAILATVVVLGALAGIGLFAWDKTRQSDYAQRLDQAEKLRKVAEVESLLGKAPQAWEANPGVGEVTGKAREFVARERGLKESFEKEMAGLRMIATAGFRPMLAQIATNRARCEQNLERLAAEYQTAAAAELSAWDARWQAFRDPELDRRIKDAEETAKALDPASGFESVRAAREKVQAALSEMGPYEVEPPPLGSRAGSLRALTNSLKTASALAEKWEQALPALASPSSLDEYLRALGQLRESPFATRAQKEAAGKIASLNIDMKTLPPRLLLPNAPPSAWDALASMSDWTDSLMPDTATSREKEVCSILSNDKNASDVSFYDIIYSGLNKPVKTETVLVLGVISTNRLNDRVGMVYNPTISKESLSFEPKTYDPNDNIRVEWKGTLDDCLSFERLGLGRLVDGNSGNFRKPVLRILDELANESQKGKITATFRAYLALKLWDLAKLRPDAWGWTWCPAAAEQIRELTRLQAAEIQSGDWFVTDRYHRFERPLREYFATVRAVSMEQQAVFLRRLARETCKKGFAFAGVADSSGRPHVRPGLVSSAELCGWVASSLAPVMLRKPPGLGEESRTVELLPYSPLFVFAGDRRELARQTLAATGYPADLARPILPPFFRDAL